MFYGSSLNSSPAAAAFVAVLGYLDLFALLERFPCAPWRFFASSGSDGDPNVAEFDGCILSILSAALLAWLEATSATG